jgi:hypothetical protein
MCAVPAIVSPVFQPAMRIVTAITQSNPASVTTSFAHNYNSGNILRIDIPPGYGMQQINQQTGAIVVTSATTFNIAINSTNYDALTTPTTYREMAQLPQCVPFAEISSLLTNAVQNVLPL